MGDEHPKLRPPVAHVIVAHDLVARKFEDAGDGVANDRAPQMADVHFLGQIGMRVVEYDLLRRVLGHAESRIGQHVPQLRGQPLALELDIDKARTGDIYRRGHVL